MEEIKYLNPSLTKDIIIMVIKEEVEAITKVEDSREVVQEALIMEAKTIYRNKMISCRKLSSL